MESIKIKHRLFEIVEQRSETSFIATFKNKKYFINKYEPHTEAGDELSYSVSRIKSSGIKAPKLFIRDRKNGYVVREFIEGQSVMSLIAEKDLDEEIYRQLFVNAYMAKLNRMTLNYEIDKWILKDGELYYVYPHFIIYDEEKDLLKRYLRLWFNTKELIQFLDKHDLSFDKTRLKDEYTTNKEIVLMTIKHYR